MRLRLLAQACVVVVFVAADVSAQQTTVAPREVGPLQKGCDGGSARDCRRLAAVYTLHSKSLGVKEDTIAALFEKACRGGDAQGCMGVKDTQPKEKAAQVYAEACDGGARAACFKIALGCQ